MTAKEKVLAAQPNAYAHSPMGGWWYVDISRYTAMLGEGNSEEAAWQNAVESLPAQPEEKAACKHSPSGKHVGREICQYCEEEMVEAKEKEPDWEKLDYAAKEHGCPCDKCAEPKPTPSNPALNVTPTFGRPTVEEILQEWADGRAYGENSHFIKEFSRHALTYIDSLKKQLKPQPEQTFENAWNEFTAGNDPDEWGGIEMAEYFWNAAKGQG